MSGEISVKTYRRSHSLKWRLRTIFAMLTAAAVALLTGCGNVTDPTNGAPATWSESPKVSPQAQQLYSMEQINSAHNEITALTFERSFEPALLDPQRTRYTVEDLNAGIFERMTPAMQEHWSATVAAGLAGNADEKDNARILRFFDWEQPTWRLPASGSALIHQGIRSVEIGAMPATPTTPQQLQITLIIDAFMELEDNGVTFPITVSKRITHRLIPAEPSAPFDWRLAAYEGHLAVDEEPPTGGDTPTESPPSPSGNEHPATQGNDLTPIAPQTGQTAAVDQSIVASARPPADPAQPASPVPGRSVTGGR